MTTDQIHYLTTYEIADMHRCDPSTVHRAIQAGLLVPDLQTNKRRLFLPTNPSLMAWHPQHVGWKKGRKRKP